MLQVDFHLSQKLGQSTLRQSLDDILLLIEVEGLLTHAQLADEALLVDLFLSLSITIVFLPLGPAVPSLLCVFAIRMLLLQLIGDLCNLLLVWI